MKSFQCNFINHYNLPDDENCKQFGGTPERTKQSEFNHVSVQFNSSNIFLPAQYLGARDKEVKGSGNTEWYLSRICISIKFI